MAYTLRYLKHDYPLGEGRFLIGRSEDCQLCLDDPLASRNHAAIVVDAHAARLEDLQSRNGVFVNQVRVVGSKGLVHGDQLRIGSQEMVLLKRGRGLKADTVIQSGPPVTARPEVFGVLGGLADKALGMGRSDEAERILGRQLDLYLSKAEEGDALSLDEFEKACGYALRIVQVTRNGKWVDYLFRMYAAHQKLMDGELVNDLYSIAPKVHGATRAQLRGYLAVLQEVAVDYAPGERFVLKRIEGLEAVLF